MSDLLPVSFGRFLWDAVVGGKPGTWTHIRRGGKDYAAYQLDLTEASFRIGDAPTVYGQGSWLIMGSEDTYARAMTNAEFQAWVAEGQLQP